MNVHVDSLASLDFARRIGFVDQTVDGKSVRLYLK